MEKTIKYLKKDFIVYVIVVILLTIMGILLVKNARDDSATTDEPIHILSGYEYWNGIYSVNPEHPPLGKMIATMPLRNIDPELSEDDEFDNALNDYYYDSWNETRNYAQKWLYGTPGNNADQIVSSSRMVVVIFALIFGIMIFFVTKKWYGTFASIITLFLYSLSPVILTHGHLANTDMWASIGFFIAIFSFAWYLEKPTILKMIIGAICFAIAICVKFSAVLLIPILGLLWIVEYYRSTNKSDYNLKKLLICFVVYFAVSTAIIWAIYGFPTNTAPDLILDPSRTYMVKSLQVLSPVVEYLPFSEYFKGLIMVFSTSLSNRPAFILGNYFHSGVWYYFPFAFLVKEPLSLLILFFSGIVFWIASKKKLQLRDFILIIPAAVYISASLLSKLNIGIRHLMPLYPFIFIFIGYFISEIYKEIKNYKKLLFPFYFFLFTLFSWYLYANISVYPYYMTYFNELAGGPENGGKLLADSNIDWGQDMKRLANWLKENNVTETIRMEYFWSGKFQPKYYGINFTELEKYDSNQRGWIAVGKSALYMPEYKWLNNYEPYETVGNSINIYYIK